MAPPSRVNPWPRIDAWLAKNAPRVLKQLNPPAGPEVAGALASLARMAGAAVPRSVTSAWSAHNGARDEANAILGAVRAPKNARWVRFMHWHSVAETQERLAFMLDLGIDWVSEDIPVGSDAGGNVLVVSAESGTVSVWDHETNEQTPIAEDFARWMSSLADDMEAGLVALDEEADEEGGELTLLDAPKPPPAPPPETGPTRYARTLLEVMAQQRQIALVRGADLDALFEELGKALTTNKNPAKRLAAVLDVLTENDAVDDVFVDDETLAALLEEFA